MMKEIFTLCFLFAFSFQLSAQDVNTFELKAGDKTYTLTQDIDPSFLGTYIKGKGVNRLQCQISQSIDESFILNMKEGGSSSNFEWDMDNKQDIQWGLQVKDNELLTTDVMEYAGGEMVSYIAYSVIVLKDGEDVTQEWMLYEFNGKKFLGQAEKIEAVAENR